MPCKSVPLFPNPSPPTPTPSMYPHINRFATPGELAEHLRGLGVSVPLDEKVLSAAEGSPLAEPIRVGDFTVGNRWCIHPMEGWDASDDGSPTEHTVRRWRHFGESGAKLIWGGEAFAVRHEGRANPQQLFYRPENVGAVRDLLQALVTAHTERFGAAAADDLLTGLQLTHSGRFCRPNEKGRLEPRIAYHHPVLDREVRHPARRRRGRAPRRRNPRHRRRLRPRGQDGPAGGLPVRRRETLPRLPGPRVPLGLHAARPLRRQLGEPQPVPAGDHRGDPRGMPGLDDRRAALGVRFPGLLSRSRAERRRQAGAGHSPRFSPALSRVRLRSRKSHDDRSDRAGAAVPDAARRVLGWSC